uniref:NADH dehydrogenase subunit 6 n=1 Tax=Slavum lentiscoides TaxID=2878228 RepID=UPI002E7853B6|nr:NADH dehydrogenase subunit 6 [Slavum lentiscoides]WRI20261.1 NADH dehydrogenase subunit 6 [Slavum lentiscoides]
MLMKMILMTNLILSINLITLKSPLKSNLNILIQSMTLMMMINLINKTSWISFMVFILYVGGLMIIFLYISSIAFNEINNKIKSNKMNMAMFLTISFLMLKFNVSFENFNFNNNYIFEDNFYMINMFIMPNNLMMYFILMILFLMLILIIWLLKINKGPIRQKF